MLDPVFFEVKNPQLRRHIAYYYILRAQDETFEAKYYAFPHTYTVLNLHQHAEFDIGHYHTTVTGKAGFKPSAIVQGIRKHPILAHLKGPIHKITILFKPLGINCFTSTPISTLAATPSALFHCWEENPVYQKFTRHFFNSNDPAEQAALFESFLESIYKPIAALETLETAIDMLNNFDVHTSVEEIADKIGMHPRSFNRLFKTHVGISPAGFRKVSRFRHSIENKLVADELQKMTDLAYQSNYYDQAYFNKIYQSLTGSNPKKFFSEVDTFAAQRLVLNFNV